MLFLWIFGDNVEDALGRLNYAVFYILSGCAAAFAQIAIDRARTSR
jgi:membrane associated rhomboid family serine protease